jgi:hypothetical protein
MLALWLAGSVALLAAIVVALDDASAQTPSPCTIVYDEDATQAHVRLAGEGSAVESVCVVRVDVAPYITVGCISAGDSAWALPPASMRFPINVPVTLGDDPELRAFAYTKVNGQGLESGASAGCATLPFDPRAPTLLP